MGFKSEDEVFTNFLSDEQNYMYNSYLQLVSVLISEHNHRYPSVKQNVTRASTESMVVPDALFHNTFTTFSSDIARSFHRFNRPFQSAFFIRAAQSRTFTSASRPWSSRAKTSTYRLSAYSQSSGVWQSSRRYKRDSTRKVVLALLIALALNTKPQTHTFYVLP